MSEQITTPEDLNALPVGSAVVSPGGYVYVRTEVDSWQRAGEVVPFTARHLITYHPARVIYRPDAEPTETRVLPTEAEVANVMEATFSDWVDRVTANEDVPETEYETMAAAVLTLFAAQPTEDGVGR